MTVQVPGCVLLDLGKVLVDFDLGRFRDFLGLYTRLGTEELRQALTSDGLPASYECGQISDEAFHAEVCRRLGCSIPREDFETGWNSIFLEQPILPDRWLSEVARRADIWIVSNTNRRHFGYVLDKYAFMRYAHGFVLSFEVGAMKPDPRIFEVALERAETLPRDAVFVDDQAQNVEAALRLGIDAFQFAGADHFAQQFRLRGLLGG